MSGVPILSIDNVLLGLGLLVGVLSIPLLLGWVPRNRIYGVRVPAAFASEANWYAINAFGAQRLLLFAVAPALMGLLCRARPDLPWWVPIACLFATLGLLLLTVRSISRFAATFSQDNT